MNVEFGVIIGHGVIIWKEDNRHVIFDDFIAIAWGQRKMHCYWMILK